MKELNIVIPIRCQYALRELKDSERGRLMLGIVDYCTEGREPDFVGYERALWPEFKAAIDEEDAKKEAIRLARAQSGKLGGRPKKSKENLMVFDDEIHPPSFPLEPPINPPKEILSKESTKKSPRFVKPTVAEIAAYCTERKNTVDPQTFFDFYECKGWLVGKVKMKDWKAAVRTWERNRGNNAAQFQDTQEKPKDRFVSTGDFEGYWETFVDGKWVRID